MLQPWETVSSRYLVNDRWMRLRADTCRTADGVSIDPFYVLEQPDFAHVIPVLPDGRIVLVRQYRHAARTFCLEFPGGVLDEGESPLEGARRELREECGATGGKWTQVADFHTNPARNTNRLHCFLAQGVVLDAATERDPSEALEQHLLTPDEIEAAIADGTFSQGTHIAAFLLARRALGLG